MKTSRHLNSRTLAIAALLALASTCSFAAASTASTATAEPVDSAMVVAPSEVGIGPSYQCFGGRSLLTKDSVWVLTDESRRVLLVAAYRVGADMPAFAKPMVKAGGDSSSRFNKDKPVIPGLSVQPTGATTATIQVGSLTVQCTRGFDD